MPKWSDVTPALVDATHCAHTLALAERKGPETAASGRIYEESDSVLFHIVAAAKDIERGEKLTMVLGALYISGLRDGWYLREDQGEISSLDSLLPEDEIAQLRREIAGTGTSSEDERV